MILRRAYYKGLNVEDTFRFWFVMYICAMAGAHVYYIVVDDYPIFASDPTVLFRLGGMSSAGAFLGALIAGLLWCLYKRLSGFEILRRLDIVTYTMPAVFAIGRLGCALSHDHQGIASNSPLAVQFPKGARFDLGLLEFLYLVCIAALFCMLDRSPRPVGFFFGLFSVLYGSIRLTISPLREQPEYVYGLAAIVIGLAGWFYMRKNLPDSSAKLSP